MTFMPYVLNDLFSDAASATFRAHTRSTACSITDVCYRQRRDCCSHMSVSHAASLSRSVAGREWVTLAGDRMEFGQVFMPHFRQPYSAAIYTGALQVSSSRDREHCHSYL